MFALPPFFLPKLLPHHSPTNPLSTKPKILKHFLEKKKNTFSQYFSLDFFTFDMLMSCLKIILVVM